MAAKTYLTIDDSPSTRMDDWVDYLLERQVPALFFCRGDHLEKNITSAVRAVQSGFVLGNHTYSHRRASDLSFEEFVDEVEKTEKLINEAYAIALKDRPGLYFRFPHIDRGCGNSQPIDFHKIDMKISKFVKPVFTEGLNVISAKKPADDLIAKKEQFQTYLKESGFSSPFHAVNLGWYKDTPEIMDAADCLYTFSTADWMVTKRHEGRWIYKTLEDLKAKIDRDQFLLKDGYVGVVLAHDQTEIVDQSIALIDHMLKRGVEFLEIE